MTSDKSIILICPKCFKNHLISSTLFVEEPELLMICPKCGFDLKEKIVEMVKDFEEVKRICKHLDTILIKLYGSQLLELYLRRLVM